MHDPIIGICTDCIEEMKKEFRIKHPRESLKIGDYVKVTFKSIGGFGEGFWIKIKEISEKISGIIDNKSMFKYNFKLGSLVFF